MSGARREIASAREVGDPNEVAPRSGRPIAELSETVEASTGNAFVVPAYARESTAERECASFRFREPEGKRASPRTVSLALRAQLPRVVRSPAPRPPIVEQSAAMGTSGGDRHGGTGQRDLRRQRADLVDGALPSRTTLPLGVHAPARHSPSRAQRAGMVSPDRERLGIVDAHHGPPLVLPPRPFEAELSEVVASETDHAPIARASAGERLARSDLHDGSEALDPLGPRAIHPPGSELPEAAVPETIHGAIGTKRAGMKAPRRHLDDVLEPLDRSRFGAGSGRGRLDLVGPELKEAVSAPAEDAAVVGEQAGMLRSEREPTSASGKRWWRVGGHPRGGSRFRGGRSLDSFLHLRGRLGRRSPAAFGAERRASERAEGEKMTREGDPRAERHGGNHRLAVAPLA